MDYDNSRPATIHIPGAGASTFRGHAILQSLLRHLLKSKCRLGSFARSFVAQQLNHSKSSGTACSELFPMPLPYPEALQSKTREADLKAARKKSVNAIVIVLNYLHLGRPRSFAAEMVGSSHMKKRQF